MPTFTRNVQILANAVVDNVLAGSQYEFLSFPAGLEIAMCSDLAGVLTTIYSGSDVLAEEGPVTVKAVGVMPIYPDDFLWEDEAAHGDRFTIKLRNTTGATRTVMCVVRITPLV